MKKLFALLTLFLFVVTAFAQTIHIEQAPTPASSSSALPYIAGKINSETYVFAADVPLNNKYPYMVLQRHANLKKFNAEQKQVFSKDLLMPAADYFIPLTVGERMLLIGVKNVRQLCIADIYSISADGEVKLEKEIGRINDNPISKYARFKAAVSEDQTKFMIVGSGYWEDANIPEGNGSFFIAVYDNNINLIGSKMMEVAASWAQFKILDFKVLNNTNGYVATQNQDNDLKNKSTSNTSLFFFNAKSNTIEEQKITLKDNKFCQSAKMMVQENGTVQVCGFTTGYSKSWSDPTATIAGVFSFTSTSPNAEPKSNFCINFSDSLRNAINGKNKVKDKKEIPAPAEINAYTIGKDIVLVAKERNSNTDTSEIKTFNEGYRIYSFTDSGRMNWVKNLSSWSSAESKNNYLHASTIINKQANSLQFIYSEAPKNVKKWKDVYKSNIVCKELFPDGALKQKTLLEYDNKDAALITVPGSYLSQEDGLATILLGKNNFRPAFIHFK